MHCLAPNCNGDGTGCDNMTCMIVTFKPYKTNILTTNHSVNSLESIDTEVKSDKLNNGNQIVNDENNGIKLTLKRSQEASCEEPNGESKKLKLINEEEVKV